MACLELPLTVLASGIGLGFVIRAWAQLAHGPAPVTNNYYQGD